MIKNVIVPGSFLNKPQKQQTRSSFYIYIYIFRFSWWQHLVHLLCYNLLDVVKKFF